MVHRWWLQVWPFHNQDIQRTHDLCEQRLHCWSCYKARFQSITLIENEIWYINQWHLASLELDEHDPSSSIWAVIMPASGSELALHFPLSKHFLIAFLATIKFVSSRAPVVFDLICNALVVALHIYMPVGVSIAYVGIVSWFPLSF